MQNKIPFRTSTPILQKLAYNDCVYAWLLVHSYEDKNEFHSYIYKDSFTFKQIGIDIHRHKNTVARRFKELCADGIIQETKVFGKTAYLLHYSNPFQYLHGQTVIKLLNLPLKDQKEELIKTLAYLLEKKHQKEKENVSDFTVSSKEILEEFGHSLGNKQSYERIRLNLTVLQGAGIIKFKTINYNDQQGMPPLMYVYYIADEGRASDEWLGK